MSGPRVMTFFLVTFFAFACLATCGAQTMPGRMSFSLLNHSGIVTLDRGRWEIAEFSERNDGTEFSIRAKDGANEFLGVLYPAR